MGLEKTEVHEHEALREAREGDSRKTINSTEEIEALLQDTSELHELTRRTDKIREVGLVSASQWLVACGPIFVLTPS